MSLNPAQNASVRSEINVTPLVDVCLVLLIIFMVVTPILQAGVRVDLPKMDEAISMPGEQSQLSVSIREDGVYLRDARIREAELREVFAGLHAAKPDRQVIVRGDRSLHYEKVCEVLTILTDAGFTRVGLVTEQRAAVER
jgi:biopolymer transport protein TolR